jgi:hypothetical protein
VSHKKYLSDRCPDCWSCCVEQAQLTPVDKSAWRCGDTLTAAASCAALHDQSCQTRATAASCPVMMVRNDALIIPGAGGVRCGDG